MPKLIHSSQFTVHSIQKSVNRQLTTTCTDKGRDNRKSKGFTLIELLVVITIIGVLASLTLASFGNAQAKARDGIRKSDLAQIKRALELAKADCSGNAYYPAISSSAISTITDAQNNYDNGTTGLGYYLKDSDLKYLSSLIKDPKNSTASGLEYKYGYYHALFSGTNVCPDESATFTQEGVDDYALAVKMERTTDKDAVDSRTKCAGKPGDSASPSGWNNSGWYVICNN